MAIYAVNVPVTTYQDTILCAYHFLTFCAQFPLYHTNSTQFASSVVLESNTGSVNAATPSRFFSSAAVFTPAHVGNYIAVRDVTNPSNTAIVVITAYISSTEVQCNAPVANFTVTATGLPFRLFNIATVPAADGYFVFTNLTDQNPPWQCIAKADLVSTSPAYNLMPTGGFDIVTELPTGANSGLYYQFSTVAQAFFVAEPTQGWYMTWTEDVGGPGSQRAAAWVGTLGSTHASAATGFPADAAYAAIFGSSASGVADNITRIPAASSIASGEAGNSDGSGMWNIEATTRVSAAGATDILSVAAMATNPRSGQQNDYDVIVAHDGPTQSIRGYYPGIRHCNDSIANRTLISGGATYVIGDGVGIVWNGKPVV